MKVRTGSVRITHGKFVRGKIGLPRSAYAKDANFIAHNAEDCSISATVSSLEENLPDLDRRVLVLSRSACLSGESATSAIAASNASSHIAPP